MCQAVLRLHHDVLNLSVGMAPPEAASAQDGDWPWWRNLDYQWNLLTGLHTAGLLGEARLFLAQMDAETPVRAADPALYAMLSPLLPQAEFRAWFGRFLPGVAQGMPRALLHPATVTDRKDPQLVHLDGLNLSRAWCMRSVSAALPAGDPARTALAESAARHAEAGLEHVASGDYAGEHWLASFAVYLLTTPMPDGSKNAPAS